PTWIHRPGFITGDGRSDAWSADDFFPRLLRGCALLGCAPALDTRINLTPVDLVARGLVHRVAGASVDPETPHTTHLVDRPFVTYERVWDLVQATGRAWPVVSYADWRVRLIGAIEQGADNPLAPLRDFFTEEFDMGGIGWNVDTTRWAREL